MTTPRQLLAVIAVTMSIVGWQTFAYPPDFLAFSVVWASAAVAAGITCALCSIRPRRFLVAASGAILVTIAAGRALAIASEVFSDRFPSREARASFIIAGIVWLLVAVLTYVVWREYVIPWSIGSRYR